MTDLLLQMAVSNAAAAGLIALAAWAVHRGGRRPAVAHALWLMVLAAFVTPPLVRIPLIPVPTVATQAASVEAATAGPALAPASEPVMAIAAGALPTASPIPGQTGPDPDGPAAATSATPVPRSWPTVLLAIWLGGSVIVLGWSLACVVRFERRLRRACRPATASIHRVAAATAARFGVRRVPQVRTVDAIVSPMAWWAGGRVTIILPAALAESLDADALRWILAHEVAHIRRRDHLVRWVEWLACVAFWWNPLSWWARRHLRINEELCCDALVLETLGRAESDPSPARGYARALMHVVEFLAAPALRPPALASAVNGGGVLETRFRMIMSKNPPSRSPRWLTAAAVAASAALMPLGFAYAADADVEAVTKRLKAAVEAGELEAQQARLMLQALRQSEADSMQRDIEQAVEAGWLTREEAARKLEALRRGGTGERSDIDRMQDELVRAELEMRRLFEAGRISEPEMDARLMEMKRAMERAAAEDALRRDEAAQAMGRTGVDRAAAERVRAMQARLEAQHAELRKLVESNVLSREGADRRLENARQATLEAMHAELRAAVESGRLSREDAQRRLDDAARSMGRSAGADLAGAERVRAMQARLEALHAELRAAVESGRLSREDADRRLEEARRRLQEATRSMRDEGARGESDAARDRRGPGADPRREFLASLESDLRRMVEAGMMTPERMRQHLDAARASMRDADSARDRRTDRDRRSDRMERRDRDSDSNSSTDRSRDRSSNSNSDSSSNSSSDSSSNSKRSGGHGTIGVPTDTDGDGLPDTIVQVPAEPIDLARLEGRMQRLAQFDEAFRRAVEGGGLSEEDVKRIATLRKEIARSDSGD
jgi:beta-lactamase regulating signal transducer with metallopeptidase domain